MEFHYTESDLREELAEMRMAFNEQLQLEANAKQDAVEARITENSIDLDIANENLIYAQDGIYEVECAINSLVKALERKDYA